MNNLMLNVSGADLSRLRALLAGVGKEVALVTSATTAPEGPLPNPALAVAWARLVDMLDLGSEPEMRECPACKGSCMKGATRCWTCWTSLPDGKAK